MKQITEETALMAFEAGCPLVQYYIANIYHTFQTREDAQRYLDEVDQDTYRDYEIKEHFPNVWKLYITMNYFEELPYQHVLNQWIREQEFKHIYVVPYGNWEMSWHYTGIRDMRLVSMDNYAAYGKTNKKFDDVKFETYELALETGLQECLTIIKNEKNDKRTD